VMPRTLEACTQCQDVPSIMSEALQQLANESGLVVGAPICATTYGCEVSCGVVDYAREQKAKLSALSPSDVTADSLAGEPITARLTTAPGNGAQIGGLKVTTQSSWFAARPSGTEDVYKIYAESFKGPEHLAQVQAEAKEVVSAALAG